ncbi:MAG TPA: heme-binding protein [Acetobacteraceae bacterium]|nr:heme-binding protein [Acetobacteraceae bacterium]
MIVISQEEASMIRHVPLLTVVLLLPMAGRAEMMTTHRIPAALASEAVAEAVATCTKQGYAETAVLVDADGVRQAVLRGDRAGSHTLDSAFDKAYTATTFKSDTSSLFERSKTAPGFSNLFTQLPHLILLGGGIVIKVNDEVVGAIGAAGAPGANLDDDCAKAGLAKIQDRLK